MHWEYKLLLMAKNINDYIIHKFTYFLNIVVFIL